MSVSLSSAPGPERSLSRIRSGNPPRCATSPNAVRLIEGQPALAMLRFLQTLEASNAGQTFVMNDLSALLPSLSSRGAKPSTPDPGET